MYSNSFQPCYQNSWALVVGINDYQCASPLTYATNDADAVASVLISDLGFVRDQVKLLKDRKATKTAIMDAYLDYVRIANSPDDRLLFFFAGHGITRTGYYGPVGFLLPADGDPENPASLIRWDDLTRNAELIPAKHILFILDACFSGLALKRASQAGVQRFLSDMLQRRARQVLTAGKGDEQVADGGGIDAKNSVFTGYLLESLSDPALRRDGILTANDLMYHVHKKVTQDSRAQQTPHFGLIDGDGDFVFLTSEGAPHKELSKDVIIETLPGMPEISSSTISSVDVSRPSFAEINGYTSPLRPGFGRNQYSEKLSVFRYDENREQITASSWLSIVVEPISNPLPTINLVEDAKRFRNYSPAGNEFYERFVPPKEVKTTFDSIILFEPITHQSLDWASYLRIDKGGNLEYCDADHSFVMYKDIRAFNYVQIVGTVWQFMFFAKDLLLQNDYRGGVRFTVNMIGTKDTILIDFSKEPGEDNKRWHDPLDRGGLIDQERLLRLRCSDPNLQMEYKLIVANLNEQSSHEVITSIARQLGLAYDHQTEPRCFNYGTGTFPWGQYFNNRR